ncbi:MAG: hypothetical protein LBQ54_15090 [Planctomycetaceae bacterium]|nr:hypothetical protein [Planctomycetaceae bacterium]
MTNARALDPGRLTLTAFGSPPNRKSFHLEAEGNCGEAACFPPAANARALHPGSLTLTSFGSPPIRKSFQQETEGN